MYLMRKREKYGIWNTKAKEFQFGICTDTEQQAEISLMKAIGRDFYKHRFIIKSMNNKELVRLHNEAQLKKQLEKIDEIKRQLYTAQTNLLQMKDDIISIETLDK